MEETRNLIGPGHIHLSGGFEAPQSLSLEFVTSDEGIEVVIDNKWAPSDKGHYTARVHITDDRFGKLVTSLETASGADHQPPTSSSFELGVGYLLPLEGGSLVGGAHEFVEGVPPEQLADTVFTFVNNVEDHPSFEYIVERDYTWYDEQEDATPKRSFLPWFIVGQAALVAAAVGVLSLVVMG